eukprot:Gregarina_sp_Pseudo_9__2044@NODE_2416_length_1003_cov_6_733402_g2223_i0_p1_GENE_NODE_2416_length_1003_cov_6_733402_g2223_i0NODE_2416_length_1003_cov_6_733402_g2223_i0_p1_ORF_typecomplete_len297_score25_75CS/PF04969_16/2_2e09Nudc_N/PF14050_6/5_8e07Chordopox_A20R/PF05941_13/0_029Chordopox_A20R/PF05941_13/5_5e02DUF1441/PF07278_11/0_31_NODE_2416_length_1003_cov_6_733402_g2223_i0111980
MQQDAIDDCMLKIAELSNGDINAVFDNIFSLFRRKTDLFILKQNENDEIGFAPGQAERTVLRAFHKQWRIQKNYVPEVKHTDISEVTEPMSTPKKSTSVSSVPNSNAIGLLRPPTISIKNGGTADLYHWTQTADAIQAEFPLRENLTKNDLTVILSSQYVSISIPRIDLDFARCLLHEIDREESTWHIDSFGRNGFEKSLIVDLQKKDTKIWWEALFKEDKENYACRDLKPQQNITELAEEEQIAIHKTIHDHVRKQDGVLTTDEQRIADVLDKARKLPGSPFLNDGFK